MFSLFQSLEPELLIASLILLFLFLILFFLIMKKWIRFFIPLFFLAFFILIDFAVKNQEELEPSFPSLPTASENREIPPENFEKQMMQAVADLKNEVSIEKENLRQVVEEVQGIFDSLEIQKEKFHSFFGQLRLHFQQNLPENESVEKEKELPNKSVNFIHEKL